MGCFSSKAKYDKDSVANKVLPINTEDAKEDGPIFITNTKADSNNNKTKGTPGKPNPNNSKKGVHSAIRWNKIEETKAYLNDFPELINSQDEGNGNAPAHIAAQNGHLEIVLFLIEMKASLNIQNKKGNTPLHMAFAYDYYEVAKVLIAAGALTDIKNNAGFRADQGIDGDKSLPLIALIASEKTSHIEDVKHALDLCAENIHLLNSTTFVSAGLKIKKFLGDEWTPEFQEQFKSIVNQIE